MSNKKGVIHTDRSAAKNAAAAALLDPDELLKTPALADWLGVAEITIKKWRMKNEGPPATRVGVRMLRYRRGDVVSWLRGRACKFADDHAPKAAQRSEL